MNPPSANSQDVTRASGSNFAASFWFLPKPKREGLTAIYAYCRLTDDLVDLADLSSDSGREEARQALRRWRTDTARAIRGDPKVPEGLPPVLVELGRTARTFKIPPELFDELIEGVGMDLDRSSYATFEELYAYCYRVAGVVGLMCLEIFGYHNLKTQEHAVQLGLAFQLTNILRDIRTDLARGRIYLPLEDLEQFGFTPESWAALPQKVGDDPDWKRRFLGLMDFECKRTRYYYRQARALLPREDRKDLVAAEVMGSVYEQIFRKIEQDPLRVLRGRVRLSRGAFAFRVLRGWLSNRLG